MAQGKGKFLILKFAGKLPYLILFFSRSLLQRAAGAAKRHFPSLKAIPLPFQTHFRQGQKNCQKFFLPQGKKKMKSALFRFRQGKEIFFSYPVGY